MTDIESNPTEISNNSETAFDQAAPAEPKKQGISIPLLLIVTVLAVAGYFGVRQIVFQTLLNDLAEEAAEEVEVAPEVDPTRRNKVSPKSMNAPGS